MTPPAPPGSTRIALGASASLLVGMGLGRFSYTPMVPALIASGALTEAEAGYVGAVNLTGYLVGALAVPWLLKCADRVALLRASLGLSVICLAASMAPAGFFWLAFWRGLIGITAAVIMILGVSSVTATAPPARTGTATSLAYMGVGTGILLSAAGLPWLLQIGVVWAWGGTLVIGLIALTVGLWGWSGEAGARARAIPPPAYGGTAQGDGLKLVVAQGLFAVGLVPHSIYWVDYLVRALDWSVTAASGQWVVFGAAAVLGTLAWGWLADRIGFRPALVAVYASLAIGATLPVLVPVPWAIVASSILVGAQPGLTAIIAGQAQKVIGAGSMLGLWRWMTLSVGLSQMLAGYALVALFNATGSYAAVFVAGGVAFTLGAILVSRVGARSDRVTLA
jgi:predicted MFS family arabinose efflux permease